MTNRTKSGGLFVPIILCAALILTAYMSVSSIDDLQGNARIINYIGTVRGATQRLIKNELNDTANDPLIEQLDRILYGLSNGSEEFNLIKLSSPDFQSLLIDMETEWAAIKEEIYSHRDGSSSHILYEMSEDYFELADETVLAAEVYTEKIVQNTRSLLIIMNITFMLLAGGCTIFAYGQERRRNKLIDLENENERKSRELSKRFQELLVPMNEISELMYVTDIDTYELLFINESGKKTFHIDDIHNMKCYKALQGFDSPCSFCTNSSLTADETYSWENTNPLTKKHYLLKDRLMEWEGRPAKMEIAFDITEAANEKVELKKRLERDTVLVDCIRELYRNRDVLNAVTNVLEQIGTLFSAERSYVFLFHDDKFSNISEWCKEGIVPRMKLLQDFPQSEYRIWIDVLEGQEAIAIDDIQGLRETMPAGYEILSRQGITNIVWVPLEKDNRLNGCIGLDNQPHNLSKSIIPFLQTIQYFITLAMQRDEDEKALFNLSYLDKLTTFFNRNRYIQDINELDGRPEPIGVAYLDVNGLKEMNDNFGHDAGDTLLKKCADIIKYSFSSGNFYRIGGDEFVVICNNLSSRQFDENVRMLKNNIMFSDCRIAVGSIWNQTSENIRAIIKRADGLMYDDKKRYYQNHHTST